MTVTSRFGRALMLLCVTASFLSQPSSQPLCRENRAQYYLDKVMSRRTLQIGRLPDFGFAEESMFLLDTNCLSDEHRAVELITKTVGFFEREANKRVNNLSGFWEVLAKTEGMV